MNYQNDIHFSSNNKIMISYKNWIDRLRIIFYTIDSRSTLSGWEPDLRKPKLVRARKLLCIVQNSTLHFLSYLFNFSGIRYGRFRGECMKEF